MLPLAICSLVAMTIIIERIFFFRGIGGKNRAEEVIGLVRQGLFAEALSLTELTRKTKLPTLPVMRVLATGIRHPHESGNMEATAIAEVSAMKRGLPALDTIITLSPLLGLLGTIIGMIKSFNVMSAAGLGQPHAVTGGVAEALIATATGIAIAVITLVPYNYFLARIERETDLIESFATRLEVVLQAPFKEKRQ